MKDQIHANLQDLSEFDSLNVSLNSKFKQNEDIAHQLKGKVITFYLDELQGYGADRVILKIADGLTNLGVEVDLVVSNFNSKSASSINPLIKVINLKGSRYTLFRNINALTTYLKYRNPSILFSSIHFNNVVATFAFMLSGIDCKLVLRQANILQKQLNDYFLPVAWLLRLLVRLSYKQATLVISQCHAMKNDIVHFMGVDEKKIRVIYNPTFTKDIAKKASDVTQHKWLKLNRDYPIILSAGRLKPQKDFQTLIKAFEKFKQRYSPDAKLIILGEGPQRGKLEFLAKKLDVFESVDFFGFCENPYGFIAAADIYVSSSRYEGLSNTLIEALSLNKKIVATACDGGTAEILKYGQYGKLVPVGNPEVMAESIAISLMSENLVDIDLDSTKDFEFENQIKKYFSLFYQMLNP